VALKFIHCAALSIYLVNYLSPRENRDYFGAHYGSNSFRVLGAPSLSKVFNQLKLNQIRLQKYILL
jgi:hypothetical protein